MKKLLSILGILCAITSLAMQDADLKSRQEIARQKLLSGAATVVIRNGYQGAGVRLAIDDNGNQALIVPEGTEAVPTGNLVMAEGAEAVEIDCIQQ